VSTFPPATLLVPCYNAARFLPRLMEAVRALHQPFAGVLAYDDGSTDDTVAVARGLGLEIITGNPNRGVAHARNQLAAAAPTPWFHFHDADDLIAPDFLTKLGPWCDERHDVVACDADWIDEKTRRVVIAWRFDSRELASAPFGHLLRHAMGMNNSIIRKSSWAAIGGCDERLAIWEDADVHIRLARAGARFHHVPEVLTWSLRRDDSFSHNYLRNWRCRLLTLESYAAGPLPAEVRPVLAEAAETATGELAVLGDKEAARRGLALCHALGFNPPTGGGLPVRFLRLFVPALPLVRWQRLRRQRAQSIPVARLRTK
jgi:glycosyltransferase involved in cell wall biosynthesis